MSRFLGFCLTNTNVLSTNQLSFLKRELTGGHFQPDFWHTEDDNSCMDGGNNEMY